MTPADYAYFKEHAEEYKITLMKYYGAERTSEARKILENKNLYAYYDANLERNDIFAATLLGVSRNAYDVPLKSEILNLKSVNEYTEVIKHLNEFTEIDAVVTGGFHVETAKALKASGISYLTITPNVTKQSNGGLYERMMSDKLTLKDFAISALAPGLNIMASAFILRLGEIAAKRGVVDSASFEKMLVDATTLHNIEGVVISHNLDDSTITITLNRAADTVRSVSFTFTGGKLRNEKASEGWAPEDTMKGTLATADSSVNAAFFWIPGAKTIYFSSSRPQWLWMP